MKQTQIMSDYVIFLQGDFNDDAEVSLGDGS